MMTRSPTFRVLFVLEWMPAYRVEFFEMLRQELQRRQIELMVGYGDAPPEIAARRDTVRMSEGVHRRSRFLRAGRRHMVWQPFREEVLRADLVIVNEGARFLLNYWLIGRQFLRRSKVAFWGHGANLDRLNANPSTEFAKRRLYRLPHWWFAYTEGSRHRVLDVGYPADRITVVQNAGSTESLQYEIDRVPIEAVDALRGELEIGSGPVGVFLGSLYPTRRLGFLLAAADEIVAAVPGFTLVVAGEGPSRDEVSRLISQRPYARMAQRVDGKRKAALLSVADLLLVPGAVGLSVTDAFAAGIPIVTTAVPTHGPEIEYLRDGVNGSLLPEEATPEAYAEEVLRLIRSPGELAALGGGAKESAGVYTQRAMVERFAEGIARAGVASLQ